jgi:hypothetical protein
MLRAETQGSDSVRRPTTVVLIALLGMVCTGRLSAADLDSEVMFHIPAQRLDNALLEFSKQANTPVAFAARSIGTLRTAGLMGKYPSRRALSVLLCNSGLRYLQVGETITVVPDRCHQQPRPCSETVEQAPKN